MKLNVFIFILSLSPLLSAAQTYTHPNIEKSVFQTYRGLIKKPSKRDVTVSLGTTFYIGDNRFVTNVHIVYSDKILSKLLRLYNKFAETNGTISKQNKQKIINLFNKEEQYLSENVSDLLFIKYEDEYLPFKKITAINFEDDIAILEIDEKNSQKMRDLIPLEIIPFSKNLTSKKGFIYGFPLDKSKSFAETLQEMSFQNIFPYNNNFFETYTNANYMNGSSGSPVLVDGKVIGVVKQSYENKARSITSTPLIELLDKDPLSLTKNQELYSLFLSLVEKTKANPEQNIKAIISLHGLKPYGDNISNMDDIQNTLNKINELENLLTDDDSNNSLIYPMMANYYLNIGKREKTISILNELSDPSSLFLKVLLKIDGGHTFSEEDLQKSADAGFNPALFAMAIYSFVKGDRNHYLKYMKKAADQGHALAQFHLYGNNNPRNTLDEATMNFDSLYLILKGHIQYISSDYWIGRFINLLSQNNPQMRNPLYENKYQMRNQ